MEFLCPAAGARLEFLCPWDLLWPAKESPMLDVIFLGAGVVLFCLLIAYERLCHRL